jgi:hypothetical protein
MRLCVGELALAQAMASAGETVFCVGQFALPDVCGLSMAAAVVGMNVVLATKTPVYNPGEDMDDSNDSQHEDVPDNDVWDELATMTGKWERIFTRSDYGNDWLLTVYALMSAAVREGKPLSYYLAIHESQANAAYVPRDKVLPKDGAWGDLVFIEKSTHRHAAKAAIELGQLRDDLISVPMHIKFYIIFICA